MNADGKVVSHDYGDLNLDRRENLSLVFDLSPATLTDGCRGLISLTNNNWSSTSTLSPFDVYVTLSSQEPFIPLAVESMGIVTINKDAVASAPVFDLSGRRVAAPAKGLYIKNGRKMLIR